MEEEKGKVFAGLWNIQAEEMSQISPSFRRFYFKMDGKDKKNFCRLLRICVCSQRFLWIAWSNFKGELYTYNKKSEIYSSAHSASALVSVVQLFVYTCTPVLGLTGKIL